MMKTAIQTMIDVMIGIEWKKKFSQSSYEIEERYDGKRGKMLRITINDVTLFILPGDGSMHQNHLVTLEVSPLPLDEQSRIKSEVKSFFRFWQMHGVHLYLIARDNKLLAAPEKDIVVNSFLNAAVFSGIDIQLIYEPPDSVMQEESGYCFRVEAKSPFHEWYTYRLRLIQGIWKISKTYRFKQIHAMSSLIELEDVQLFFLKAKQIREKEKDELRYMLRAVEAKGYCVHYANEGATFFLANRLLFFRLAHCELGGESYILFSTDSSGVTLQRLPTEEGLNGEIALPKVVEKEISSWLKKERLAKRLQ